MADIVLTIDPDDTAFALHDRANGRRLMGFDAPVPETDSQWAYSADTEGERRANLRYRNRTITADVLLDRSTAALLEALENTLGQKIGKLAREGGELRFTYPTGTTITFNVLEASFNRTFDIADMAKFRARYEITFLCEPFGLGAEEDLGDNTETTLPCLIFTEATVDGDVPALGRLVIDDDQAVNQWWMTWGIQSRYYSSSANAALFYEAEGRTAMGGAATAAGASASGGNVMNQGTLRTTYQAMLSTQATGGGAHLSHVGSFRVYARVLANATNTGVVSMALEWGPADFGTFTTNPAVEIPVESEGGYIIADLGIVSLAAVTSGTQRWEGRIIAKSTVYGDQAAVDYLMLVPVDEGSGIASGVTREYTPTSYVGEDHFTSTTAGNALNARVAPTGGTWATSGDATDLAFDDDSVDSVVGEHVKRTAVSGTNGRFAVLGSTNYTNVQVQASIFYDTISSGQSLDQAVIARWTDSNNHLVASLTRINIGGNITRTLKIAQVVSGSPTTIASTTVTAQTSLVWWRLGLTVNTAGLATATLTAIGPSLASGVLLDQVVATAQGSSSALATGGTLATGKPGIWERVTSAGAVTRYYDDFLVASIPSDAAAFASQSIEVRYDRVQREDSGGTMWTPVSSYKGDYLFVPPSGAEGRTARVIVKMTRNDPSQLDSAIADDLSAKLFVTPRYLVVPAA